MFGKLPQFYTNVTSKEIQSSNLTKPVLRLWLLLPLGSKEFLIQELCAHGNRNAAALVRCKQILRGHRTEAQHEKGSQGWNSALSPMALHSSDN